MMTHIKKIILFIARIIAASFASFCVAFFVVILWLGLLYMSDRYPLFNNLSDSVFCYALHTVPMCEIHLRHLGPFVTFLSEIDVGRESLRSIEISVLKVLFYLSKYGVADFFTLIFEACLYVLKPLYQSSFYAVTGFIAVLVFKFMWNLKGQKKHLLMII
jgi:hypothetical protein